MPLIRCPDCQTEISDAAPSCIKCGRPMESEAIVSEVFVPPPSLSFTEAVATCFRKYADFSGRASRSEFWYFFLFSFIVSSIAEIVDIMNGNWTLIFGGPYVNIFLLVTFFPDLAVTARRLHDTNRSGWRQLWIFTGIGLLFVWFWCARKGNDHNNSHN